MPIIYYILYTDIRYIHVDVAKETKLLHTKVKELSHEITDELKSNYNNFNIINSLSCYLYNRYE